MGKEEKKEEEKGATPPPPPAAQPKPPQPAQPPAPKNDAKQLKATIRIENTETGEVILDTEMKEIYYKFQKTPFFKQAPPDAYEKGDPIEIENIGLETMIRGFIVYPEGQQKE